MHIALVVGGVCTHLRNVHHQPTQAGNAATYAILPLRDAVGFGWLFAGYACLGLVGLAFIWVAVSDSAAFLRAFLAPQQRHL